MKSLISTVKCRDDNELLETLSEELPVGVCIMQNGKFCYVNSTFPIAIGYTADELVGKGSLDIVAPEDRETVKQNTMKMLKGELHSPYQFRVTCKDGSIVWVMATVRPIQYHGKRATLGNYMEITERKLMEERIRERETRYRLLAENVQDMIWTVDITCPTRLTYISPSVTRLLGYGVEESMTKEMEAIFTPASFNVAMKAFAEEMAGEQKEHSDQHRSRRLELQLRHKDGSLVDVDVNFSLIRGADGQKGGILAVARDITRHNHMQEALRDSEERYRELADSITDVFFAMDDNLRYTYWNKASEILTGVRAQDAIGKSIQEVFPDRAWRRKAEKMYRKVLKTQQLQTFVNDYDVDGKHYILEINAYPSRGGVSVFVKDISERKRAEEALRESEEKYRRMFEEALDAIFIADAETGILIDCNRAACELVGKKWSELIGKHQRILHPPEETEGEFSNTFSEHLRAKEGNVIETQVVTGKGEIKEVAIKANVFEFREKKVIQGIFRDITERKQAEEALSRSEERYRTILEEMGDGYFETDLAGNVTFANDALINLLGYSREEITGMNFRALRPKEEVEGVFKAYNCMYRTGEPLRNFPSEIVCKDGSHVFAESSAFPIRNDRGEIVGFRGVRRDVTARKQMEEALRHSEEKYRTILQDMEDSYFEVDLGGHLTFVNNSLCRDLGYSKEELMGKSYKDFTAQEDTESVFRVFSEVYRTGVPNKGFAWKTVRKDGTHGFAETSISLLRNDKGESIGFRGVGRDVAERKEAEERLRQSEENYKTLFDSSVIGMYVLDIETMKVVMANEAARKLAGFDSESGGIGANPFSFVVSEDRQKLLEVAIRDFLQDSFKPREIRVLDKDGRRGWISVSSARITHEGKWAALVSMMDITERKQAEEALRQSEEKHRTILEETEDSYFEVDLGGHLTFVNNSLCRDLGYSKEELMGKSYKDFTAQEDTESVFRVFSEVYRTGVPNKGFAWKTVRKDGTHGFAETSISLLRNDKGESIGFRGVGRDIAERKKAEEALNIQRAYFQQLFDTSPDAIIMMDTDDRAIQVNKGFEKLFGYSNEEAKGRSLIELIVPEEDAQEASKSLERILSGETVRKESVRRCKDGSVVDVSVLAYPICSNGKLIGAYGIYTDITERKRQEQALADQATRRRLLIDQSLDGIVVLDTEAKVVEANQRFAEMLGYTMEEIRQLHTWDWDKNFPPQRIVDMGRNVDEKGFHLETKHTRKDGSVIDVDISINGAMLGAQKLIFCVCRDVTERKEMEDALKLAAEEWRNTFDSISDAISIHDRDFRILRANKAFADMFHMSPDQIIGRHCYELHQGKRPISGCPHKQTLATGRPAAAEFYESDLGKYLLESTSSILDEKGEIVGTIHIIRDITEQKRQNERLMMTDRLASIGELASGTAHELNNPLTSIIGFSQLLMEREVPDDIREDLKVINSEAQRAADVTKNLLTFARKHAPVKQLGQINNIVEDVLKLRAYEHKVNNIAVVKKLHPDLPEMMVDYFQMQQVFMNIIINAEYFMTATHKKGTLTIITRRQNSSVVVSFADDGPGIPPENLKRIFDPFFTTKEVGKGTGLGLSICHGIVTEHGGQIYAKSRLGKGATIHVELPIDGEQNISKGAVRQANPDQKSVSIVNGKECTHA